MNEKVRKHVAAFNETQGWETSDESIIDTIREAKEVFQGKSYPRRWWSEHLSVVEVNGMLIGFDDASTTGDDSPRDKGWEFDPDSICEVRSREVTTTVYERVKD